MRPPKINDRKLLRLIDRQQMSQSEAAKELGVTKQAVNQRLKELRGKTTKVIVAKEYKQAAQQGFDAMQQLLDINKKSLSLLDEAEGTDDPQFALKCIAELRNQIKLAADIQLTMYSIQDAHGFMSVIKEALREASPDAYKKFRELIDNERSVRSVLRFS